MKNIIISLVFISIFACKSRLNIGHSTKIGNNNDYLQFGNFGEPSKFYVGTHIFLQNKISKSIILDQNGNIFSYQDCNLKGGDTTGITIYFDKNRILKFHFQDSIGRTSGPYFIYKKNGKLKHIYVYKNNHYDSTYYTSCKKCLGNDTVGLSNRYLLKENQKPKQ